MDSSHCYRFGHRRDSVAGLSLHQGNTLRANNSMNGLIIHSAHNRVSAASELEIDESVAGRIHSARSHYLHQPAAQSHLRLSARRLAALDTDAYSTPTPSPTPTPIPPTATLNPSSPPLTVFLMSGAVDVRSDKSDIDRLRK